jgi:hypothetical protein
MTSFRQAALCLGGSRQAGGFKKSLVVFCALSAALLGGQAVQAGPTLETRESTAIGAQANFNNSWAQTFEVKGAMTVNNTTPTDLLAPFVTPTTPTLSLPNSGLASLQAQISNLTVAGGVLGANSQLGIATPLSTATTPVRAAVGGGTAASGSGVVLNQSATDGLPALRITPGTADSSVIGASIIGTNIGTDSLQVTGSLNTTVINTLTAF